MSAFGFDMPDGPTVITCAGDDPVVLGRCRHHSAVGLVAGTPCRPDRTDRGAARGQRRPLRGLDQARRHRHGRHRRRDRRPRRRALQGKLALVGIGALATFIGVAVLGPVLARPVAKAFGLPLRARGVAGELATRNAMRNPKRTARTAASLMIGVALVGFITVFAASAKTSIAGSLDTEFTGTHIVETGGYDNSVGLSPELADDCGRRLASTW